jgi:hypothetical protein
MTDKDFAIGVTAVLPTAGALMKKPPHLIYLTDGKGKVTEKFLSMDKPEFQNGFIQVKGLYVEASDDEISKSFFDILTNSSKELILEMMFPWHRISGVRNLVFKAK